MKTSVDLTLITYEWNLIKETYYRSCKQFFCLIFFYAVAICLSAAGQIAYQTIFCYLSGGRTNSLKWSQMLFVRLLLYKISKLFDPLPLCNTLLHYMDNMDNAVSKPVPIIGFV